MEVKPVDNDTRAGDLPKEWRIDSIGSLINEGFILSHLDGNHGELYPRSHEFKPYGIPYIGANEFEDGRVNFDRCKFLSAQRAKQFRKGVAKDGDVLFAHNATVGPVALLRTNEPFVILSTTATYFRCDPAKLNNSYLMAALQSTYFVRQYQAVMAQSTRFQVPITAQRKLLLTIPPISEQRAIGATLNDMDALLRAQDLLIAKKRDLKQAAGQQLLTGRARLPGFDAKWELKTLRELIQEIADGATPSTADPRNFGGRINWAVIDDIKDQITTTATTLTERGLQSCAARLWPPGTLILSTGATIGQVGIAQIPVATKQGICGIVVDQGAASARFLKYWFAHNKSVLLSKAQGSTIKEVRAPTLLKLELLVPTVLEQNAIAELLTAMDAELAALEARREKTRNLKQAMMQELLTGKTRLV